MKHRIFTRLFAVLFVVVMVCSVLPLGASAVEKIGGYTIDKGTIYADPDQTLTLDYMIQLRCPYCDTPWIRDYDVDSTGIHTEMYDPNPYSTENCTATIIWYEAYDNNDGNGAYWDADVVHVTYNTNGMKPGDAKTITVQYRYRGQIALWNVTGSGDHECTCSNPQCRKQFYPTDFERVLNDTLKFTVKIKQDPLSINLCAKKNLDNSPANVNDFKFELHNSSNGGLVQHQPNNGGNIKFTAITFKEAGDYSFELYEVNQNSPKYIYDETQYTVQVKVISNDEGELVLAEGYPKFTNKTTGEVVSEPVFNNISRLHFSGTKEWKDGDNADGKRPDTFKLSLKANGTVVKTLTVNTDKVNKTQTWAFEGYYDRNDASGKPITYTIEEEQVADYKAPDVKPVTLNTTNSEVTCTVTNERDYAKIDIPVTKTWEDDNDRDGARPDTVTVHLMNGTKTVDTLELKATDGWKGEFKDVTKNHLGTPIVYSVTEGAVADYTCDPKTDIKGTAEGGFTIQNHHTPATIKIPVSKVWYDNNNADNTRPGSVTINLKVGDQVQQSLPLNKENNWKGSFDNLFKCENGTEIQYTVEEAPVTGYASKKTGDITNGFTFTNTKTQNISVEKVWDDNDDQDNLRKNVTIRLKADGKDVEGKTLTLGGNNLTGSFDALPMYNEYGAPITYSISEDEIAGYESEIKSVAGGYQVTNTHTPETVSVRVTKEWDHRGDETQENTNKPTSVTMQLVADGTDVAGKTLELTEANKVEGNDTKWTGTFADLPKYKHGQTAPIAYTVKEVEVPADYVASNPTGDAATGYTIKNTFKPGTIEINVTKEWDDGNNQDGIRPDKITVKLMRNKGQDLVESKEVTPNTQGKWTTSFNVPGKDHKGEIDYSVSEEAVAGYTPSEPTGDKTTGFTIKNTHIPETIDKLTVTKNWDDFDNKYSTRPDSVTVNIKAGGKTVATATLTKDENWTKELTELDLPVKKGGAAIEYEVEEVTVADYTSTVSGKVEDNGTVTVSNTLNTVSGGITVNKVWKADRKDKRPDSITVYLYANNGNKAFKTAEIKPNDAGEWTYTFTDLPATKDGKKIEYTIIEKSVPGYNKPAYSGDMDSGFTVTNTKLATPYTFSGKLIQTGQLNWPVPVLALGGVALMMAGIYLLLQKKKGRYEH